MRKILSASLIASFLMVSSSVFAGEKSLNDIMAKYQDEAIAKGAKIAAGEAIEALSSNGISTEEMRDYLSSELPPKDFIKVAEFLDNKNNSQDNYNDLLQSLGQGANFRSGFCERNIAAVLAYGSLIAFVYFANDAIIDGENLKVLKDHGHSTTFDGINYEKDQVKNVTYAAVAAGVAGITWGKCSK